MASVPHLSRCPWVRRYRHVTAGMTWGAQDSVRDLTGDGGHSLQLWASGPRWQFSTAPLLDTSGKPLESPRPGAGGGRAMLLTDQQVAPTSFSSRWFFLLFLIFFCLSCFPSARPLPLVLVVFYLFFVFSVFVFVFVLFILCFFSLMLQ
jgi:hypothetical protein